MIQYFGSTGQRYDEIKRQIDHQFPAGRFVAVENGQVVANAETHDLLSEELHRQNKSPKDLIVLQAGVVYPDSGIIFGGAVLPSANA